MKIRNAAFLLACAASATGCAFLENLLGIVSDPLVREKATGVVANAVAGNYIAALSELGELIAAGVFVWKATNMTRDRARSNRGEPTTKTSSIGGQTI